MIYLIPVIAFSGLLIGILIARLSKDELKTGEPYFYTAKKLLIFSIFVILVSNFDLNIINSILLITGVLLGFYIKLPYFFLGLALLPNLNSLILPSLIFTYGLIHSTSEKGFIKEALAFFIPFSLLLTPIHLYTHSLAAGLIVLMVFV